MENTLLDNAGLLYAARLLPDGKKLKFDPEDPWNEDANLVWLHMCARSPDTRRFLEESGELDDIVINSLLSDDSRPRTLKRRDGLLIDLRAMNLWEGEKPEEMISLRIWCDGKKIITTRVRDIRSIKDIQSLIDAGNGPTSAGNFLTMIISRVFERMEPCIDDMEDRISSFEELIDTGQIEQIGKSVGAIRAKNAILRRHIIPQEKVLTALIRSDIQWFSKDDVEQFTESHDRVVRYTESLNDLRDRLQIINEGLARASDAALGKTSYIFSLAATIFLPLSFLTGLLGVNVGGLPGLNDDMAFWRFSLICAAIASVQIFVFRMMKWF